ncbi:hypothetical protein NDU88_011743 [Pleurodeles waltl]|uniref:Uncharacterized protein n=1 Tax=Pleurodeles waltl TaxID=8319 RepID=A0AAV7R1A0_PLEWA|nr:hypothetical protein NDU88_011743 [Pleurodeles waltl]
MIVNGFQTRQGALFSKLAYSIIPTRSTTGGGCLNPFQPKERCAPDKLSFENEGWLDGPHMNKMTMSGCHGLKSGGGGDGRNLQTGSASRCSAGDATSSNRSIPKTCHCSLQNIKRIKLEGFL